MSAASDYLEEQLGTHLLRTGSFTKPSTIYVALFTTLPDEDGTNGVEVNGAGYARVQHGPSDATWAAPVGGDGVFSNVGSIQFGSPTANWGTIVGFGLYDASTAGNLLIADTLSQSVIVSSGDPAPAFAEGALTISFA